MMCHDGKELNLKLPRTPMVGRTKWNLVLTGEMNNEKNNGRGSIGTTPRDSWGPRKRRTSSKSYLWDVGGVQGYIHQRIPQNVTAKEWKATLLNERLTS